MLKNVSKHSLHTQIQQQIMLLLFLIFHLVSMRIVLDAA